MLIGLGIFHAYFHASAADSGEYLYYVESAMEFLSNVGVVHKPTTNNITFQHQMEDHSLDDAFVSFIIEDDPHKHCKACHWYVEYGKFCRFIRNV